MVDPKLPSNPTAMLMQAQERKKLVNNLINLKKGINQSEPLSYSHLGTGRINRRNEEVRKINGENQQMLKKIMNIMNRKPKGNGLDGVPLKKYNDLDEFDKSLDQKDGSFQGNADISLIQSNVDTSMVNNRFSFEINPAASSIKQSNNPFKSEQDQSTSMNVYATQPLNSPQADANREQSETQILAESGPSDLKETSLGHDSSQNVKQQSRNPFGISAPQISTAQSQNFEQKDVQSSQMFDDNLPPASSESPFAFHPQQQASAGNQRKTNNSLLKPTLQTQDTLTFNREPFGGGKSTIQGKNGKKLYPAQVTLNHGVRKREVERINRENLVMLKALKEIKPTVERAHQAMIHDRQQEVYKRNCSKFRQVGRSQPRPVQRRNVGMMSEVLPEINRSGSNQTDIKPLYSENLKPALNQRRTSQGNRSYLDQNPQQFAVPVSQRMHYRNQRNYMNSNQDMSEYQGTASTRQGTVPDEADARQSLGPENTKQAMLPATGMQVTYQTTAIGSIESSSLEQNDIQNANRRPSYLQKLKKSPLLQSMTHQQKIPKSIVNRVISQREQIDRNTFRKYGVVNRQTTSFIPIAENYTMPTVAHQHKHQQASVLATDRRTQKKMFESRVTEHDEDQSMRRTPSLGKPIVDVQVRQAPAADKDKKRAKTTMPQSTPAQKDSPQKLSTKHQRNKTSEVVTEQLVQTPVQVESFALPADPEDGARLDSPAIAETKSEDKEAQKKSLENQQEKPNKAVAEDEQAEHVADEAVLESEEKLSEYAKMSNLPSTKENRDTVPRTSGPPLINQNSERSSEVVAAPQTAPNKGTSSPVMGSAAGSQSKTQMIKSSSSQAQPEIIEDNSVPVFEQEASDTKQDAINCASAGKSQAKASRPALSVATGVKASTKNPSIKSLPATEGSKHSIPPEDKGTEKVIEQQQKQAEDIEVEYSIANESQEEGEEYSDGGFEADSPLKNVQEQHAATSTELRSPLVIHTESQDLGMGKTTEKSRGAAVRPAVDREASKEIEEDIPLMTEKTGDSQKVKNVYPRQATFEIREDIVPSPNSYMGSRADIPIQSVTSGEDVTSQAKTITVSKSQAGKNYVIDHRISALSYQNDQNMKLEQVPVENDVRGSHPVVDVDKAVGRATPAETDGTGMNTVQASAKGAPTGIQQSKENIILSEQSSFKRVAE